MRAEPTLVELLVEARAQGQIDGQWLRPAIAAPETRSTSPCMIDWT